MTDKILFVDDDPNILKSYKRNLGFDFNIDTALGGEEGLKILSKNGTYAVVVSDMRMPGMDGTAFLSQVHERWPDTVRMLLTGQADMNDSIAVVNKGQIFRFLTKPCTPDAFSTALKDAIKQYRLITSEKELLGQTLKGSIKLLIDILSIVNPRAFSRSNRVRKLAKKIARRLKLDNLWQVDLAVLLSHIGYVTISEDLISKKYRNESFNSMEKQQFYKYLENGSKLIKNIPRLEDIAEVILYQEKLFNGEGPPFDKHLSGKQLPIISRILKVIYDFDAQTTKGYDQEQAYKRLLHQKSWYDPDVFTALKFELLTGDSKFYTKEIVPENIETGMTLAQDVRSKTNLLLAAKNQEVTETLRMCILNFAHKNELEGPITIQVSSN